VRAAILEIISSESRVKPGEINVSFISDRKIKKLNCFYHGRDITTDVLAFDLSRDKKDPQTELYLYVIHGVLHLSGYDDHSPRQTKLMRKKEKTYLKWLLSKPKQ
jgi:probable rRNA maturation factor